MMDAYITMSVDQYNACISEVEKQFVEQLEEIYFYRQRGEEGDWCNAAAIKRLIDSINMGLE